MQFCVSLQSEGGVRQSFIALPAKLKCFTLQRKFVIARFLIIASVNTFTYKLVESTFFCHFVFECVVH